MSSKQHGGRRAGAGRPPAAPEQRATRRVALTIKVPPPLRAAYDAVDAATKSQAREAMIKALSDTLRPVEG